MIDWDRLNTLRADIGEDDFAEVAALFISEINEHLDRMKSAPHPVSRDDFHFLRGSAANLGFRRLETACSEAETALQQGITPSVDRIAGIFAQSLSEVAPHLPGLTHAA